MLLGEFTTNLGERNRIAIPKRLRDELEQKIYITRGYEQSLIIIDSPRWKRFIQQINERPLFSADVRNTKRFILGGSLEIEPDTQGRFVLSESHLKFSGITDGVIFIGVGEWIELWDKNRWEERLAELKIEVSDIADRLYTLQ